MTVEDQSTVEPARPDDRADDASSELIPEIEDAYAQSEPPTETVGEDDPQLLEASGKLTDDDTATARGEIAGTDEGQNEPVTSDDDTSDTEAIADDPPAPDASSQVRPPVNWDRETSAHVIGVELKRVETEVRSLLEDRDSKRKRKLAGTRRWQELQDDVMAWKFAGRIDEAVLARLEELVARRHYLFARLRFVAGTRPGWNS